MLASDVKLEKEFTSIVDMHLFIQDYYSSYPVQGYDTNIIIETMFDSNNIVHYKVKINRYGSCD